MHKCWAEWENNYSHFLEEVKSEFGQIGSGSWLKQRAQFDWADLLLGIRIGVTIVQNGFLKQQTILEHNGQRSPRRITNYRTRNVQRSPIVRAFRSPCCSCRGAACKNLWCRFPGDRLGRIQRWWALWNGGRPPTKKKNGRQKGTGENVPGGRSSYGAGEDVPAALPAVGAVTHIYG